VFALVGTRITHLIGVLSVLPPSPSDGAVASMMAVSSSSGTGGVEPSSTGALLWNFLPMSSQYAYGVDC
jgi:hypothetical protein